MMESDTNAAGPVRSSNDRCDAQTPHCVAANVPITLVGSLGEATLTAHPAQLARVPQTDCNVCVCVCVEMI
jgi:hypothetical protein